MKIRRTYVACACGLLAVFGILYCQAGKPAGPVEGPDAFAVPLIEAITQGVNPGTTGTPLLMLINVCPRWPFCPDEKTLLYTQQGGKVLFYWYRKDKPCTLTYNPTGECANAESKGFEVVARLIEQGKEFKVVDGRLYWKGVYVYAFSLEGLKLTSFAFTGRLFFQKDRNSRQYFSQPVHIKKHSLTVAGPAEEESSIIPGASPAAAEIPVTAIFAASLVAGVLLLPALKARMGPRLGSLHPMMAHCSSSPAHRDSFISRSSSRRDFEADSVITRKSSCTSLVARDDDVGIAELPTAKDFSVSWTTTAVPSEHTGSIQSSLLSASIFSGAEPSELSSSLSEPELSKGSATSSLSRLASYLGGMDVHDSNLDAKALLTPIAVAPGEFGAKCSADATMIRVKPPDAPEYIPFVTPRPLPGTGSSPRMPPGAVDTPPFGMPCAAAAALRLAGTDSPGYAPRVGNIKLPRSANTSPWSPKREIQRATSAPLALPFARERERESIEP
jgi:hypothetical protein